MMIIASNILPLKIPTAPAPAPARAPSTPLMMLAPMLPRDWSRHPITWVSLLMNSLNYIIIVIVTAHSALTRRGGYPRSRGPGPRGRGYSCGLATTATPAISAATPTFNTRVGLILILWYLVVWAKWILYFVAKTYNIYKFDNALHCWPGSCWLEIFLMIASKESSAETARDPKDSSQ